MAESVYILCAVLSTACAVLLVRGYQRTPTSLLVWSSVCFGLLALNNVVLVVDLVIFPEINMNGLLLRNTLGAAAGSLLLFGLIWEMT